MDESARLLRWIHRRYHSVDGHRSTFLSNSLRGEGSKQEHPRLAATPVGTPTDSDPFPPASAALPRHVAVHLAHLFNYRSCKEAGRVKTDKKKSCCCS
ncbi:hypothetical protein MUK42_36634 [Musa troglodytarum]|uniref:Uncharacterized protein n=1 Tax=Musa troglodytarum TaxID=320322 RepID=A0A9E7GAP0_9LILI|nr:hypothetical protein MUK42_36634 [Musa troglodytarum]